MINKVILVGRTGGDIDITTFENGNQIGRVSLATSETYKDQKGQKQELTQWHRLRFRNKACDIIKQYAPKGSQLYVEGKIVYDSYQDKEGNTVYTTDIDVQEFKFLGSKKEG